MMAMNTTLRATRVHRSIPPATFRPSNFGDPGRYRSPTAILAGPPLIPLPGVLGWPDARPTDGILGRAAHGASLRDSGYPSDYFEISWLGDEETDRS